MVRLTAALWRILQSKIQNRLEENFARGKVVIVHWQAARVMQTCDPAIFIHALTEIFNIFRYFKEMEEHEF